MTDPSTSEGWLDVARERGADARAMLPEREKSVGPAYMAGYAVEGALKAYLQAQGIPRPTSGPAGHDLAALFKAAGLRLQDLNDSEGHAAFFLSDWSTALRYQAHKPDDMRGFGSLALVEAAGRLVGLLTARIKRRR